MEENSVKQLCTACQGELEKVRNKRTWRPWKCQKCQRLRRLEHKQKTMPLPKDNHLYKNKYLTLSSMTLEEWATQLKLGSGTIQKRKREGVLYREELGEV